jgi:hypothetical protein
MAHLGKAGAEKRFYALVPIHEFSQHLAEQPCDLFVGER